MGFLNKRFNKNSWKKILRDIILFVLILTGVSFYIQRNMISGKAPAIEATTIYGEHFSLLNKNKKPTLVYFWGTWCGYCRFTSPMVESISKDYPVISIAVSSGSNQQINEYLKTHNLTYSALNDGNGYFSQQWGVSGVPSIFIVDKDGNITSTTQGPTTSWGLRARLWLAR